MPNFVKIEYIKKKLSRCTTSIYVDAVAKASVWVVLFTNPAGISQDMISTLGVNHTCALDCIDVAASYKLMGAPAPPPPPPGLIHVRLPPPSPRCYMCKPHDFSLLG